MRAATLPGQRDVSLLHMRLDNDLRIKRPESGNYQGHPGDAPVFAKGKHRFRCRFRRDDCVRRDVARKPKVFQKRGPHRIDCKMMRKLQSGLDVSRHVLHKPPLLQ